MSGSTPNGMVAQIGRTHCSKASGIFNLQFVDQPFSCALRLVKGLAADDLTRALVCDAKHQHTAATVGKSATNLGSFVGIKAPFCLFELIVLSFFGIQQIINRYHVI